MAETEEKKISSEELLNYLFKALTERKSYMNDAYNKAINPLDRLSLRDKMDEIDIVLNYLQVK